MLQRARQADDDHHEDLREILRKIPDAQGTERQVLIAEYLLAASKLPPVRQADAQRRLLDLFEHKR